MTDYKELANAYMKASRARCIITVMGVMFTIIVLYGGLNIAYSYLQKLRHMARETDDYEFVVMTDSREEAERIAADNRIKKAYIGQYEYETYGISENDEFIVNKKLYKNALYATGQNPYIMQRTMEKIKRDYNADTILNEDLAMLYFQQATLEDGSALLVIVILIILIAYIFAIFAVGMIRNTIQMFLLEQVKDYGILRCIGATKKQLKKIIYKMGLTLEISGIIAGTVIGGAITMTAGIFLDLNSGYHIVPLIPILICYLGDLYFVIRESCKLVTQMTPVSAVRGEFRIKKEKIRVRGKGLLGLIFGIEGEYARKSVMRNRGRFMKTVAAITVSIGALVAVMSISGSVDNVIDYIDSLEGEYQYEIVYSASPWMSVEEAQSMLPPPSVLSDLASNSHVIESRKVYSSDVMVSDCNELYSMLDKEYLDNTDWGYSLKKSRNMYEETLKENGGCHTDDINAAENILSQITLYGLDEADKKDMEKYLVDGTLDVDDQGVIMVTGGSTIVYTEDELSGMYKTHVKATDYKVGDTIELVDTKLLYERAQAELEKMEEPVSDSSDNDILEYADNSWDIVNRIYRQMKAAGEVHTYKVEGIVDIQGEIVNYPMMYTSLDNYLAETGYDRSQISGVKYKIDSHNITMGDMEDLSYGDDEYFFRLSSIVPLKRANIYIVMVVAFVFTLSAVNIINSTAGSLHMRRKEFAQLRVIGMSRKRLIKTALLEGVMVLVPANIMGGLLGTAIYYLEYYYINMLAPQKFEPSVIAMFIGLAVSSLLLLGSIYVPVGRLPIDMAEDLAIEE